MFGGEYNAKVIKNFSFYQSEKISNEKTLIENIKEVINKEKNDDAHLWLLEEKKKAKIGDENYDTLSGVNLFDSYQAIPTLLEYAYKYSISTFTSEEAGLKEKFTDIIGEYSDSPGIINSLVLIYRLVKSVLDPDIQSISDDSSAQKWLEKEGVLSGLTKEQVANISHDLYVYSNGAYFYLEKIFRKIYEEKIKKDRKEYKKQVEDEERNSREDYNIKNLDAEQYREAILKSFQDASGKYTDNPDGIVTVKQYEEALKISLNSDEIVDKNTLSLTRFSVYLSSVDGACLNEERLAKFGVYINKKLGFTKTDKIFSINLKKEPEETLRGSLEQNSKRKYIFQKEYLLSTIFRVMHHSVNTLTIENLLEEMLLLSDWKKGISLKKLVELYLNSISCEDSPIPLKLTKNSNLENPEKYILEYDNWSEKTKISGKDVIEFIEMTFTELLGKYKYGSRYYNLEKVYNDFYSVIIEKKQECEFWSKTYSAIFSFIEGIEYINKLLETNTYEPGSDDIRYQQKQLNDTYLEKMQDNENSFLKSELLQINNEYNSYINGGKTSEELLEFLKKKKTSLKKMEKYGFDSFVSFLDEFKKKIAYFVLDVFGVYTRVMFGRLFVKNKLGVWTLRKKDETDTYTKQRSVFINKYQDRYVKFVKDDSYFSNLYNGISASEGLEKINDISFGKYKISDSEIISDYINDIEDQINMCFGVTGDTENNIAEFAKQIIYSSILEGVSSINNTKNKTLEAFLRFYFLSENDNAQKLLYAKLKAVIEELKKSVSEKIAGKTQMYKMFKIMQILKNAGVQTMFDEGKSGKAVYWNIGRKNSSIEVTSKELKDAITKLQKVGIKEKVLNISGVIEKIFTPVQSKKYFNKTLSRVSKGTFYTSYIYRALYDALGGHTDKSSFIDKLVEKYKECRDEEKLNSFIDSVIEAFTANGWKDFCYFVEAESDDAKKIDEAVEKYSKYCTKKKANYVKPDPVTAFFEVNKTEEIQAVKDYVVEENNKINASQKTAYDNFCEEVFEMFKTEFKTLVDWGG